MKATIEIAGEVFESRAAVKRRVRPMLKQVGLLAEADDAFMQALLMRHRRAVQKVGVGVRRIRTWKVPPYNTIGFYIERIDGTGTDFSYLQCIEPDTTTDWFVAACRTAVVPQVLEAREIAFANNRIINCPVTGQPITRANSHVDHAPPWTFKAIVDAFVQEHEIDVELVPLLGRTDNETVKSFAEPEAARLFAEFHRSFAQLRVVSEQANLSVLRKGSGR